MTNQVLIWIKEQLATNEFFKGGFLVVALGAILGVVGYWGRRIPGFIWLQIKRLLLITVSFDENAILYQHFQSWINDGKYLYKKRDVVLKINDKTDPPEICIVPDRRAYLVRISGIWCRLLKKRDDVPTTQNAGGMDMTKLLAPDRVQITCFIWNRKKLLKTLNCILQQYGISQKDFVPVYEYMTWGYWQERCRLSHKTIDRLILREGQSQDIFDDIQEFLDSREWYDKRQIPYQRGYMLCGPPGTGKTTLISTIASHFGLRLCIVDLSNIEKDSNLKSLFTKLPNRALVVIEDFDSYFEGRKILLDKSGLTFSGLLNAINGVITSPGRILIMTTNISQDVDPALLRIGRIDRLFKLENVDESQAKRIVQMFQQDLAENDIDEFCAFISRHNVSPADLIGHLQKYRNDPQKILNKECFIIERDDRRNIDITLKEQQLCFKKEKKDTQEEKKDDE